MDEMQWTGSFLREHRIANQLTFRAIAEAMGTSTSRVFAIERAERPRPNVVRRYLCAVAEASRRQGYRLGIAAIATALQAA